MASPRPLVILRINLYQTRSGREVYNYKDSIMSAAANSDTCIVDYKGQKSGQHDKKIVPGAYLVLHPSPTAPIKVIGRVETVTVSSVRTTDHPAIYRLVVRRMERDFKGFKSISFPTSRVWHGRQRHMANMFVKWFDVDPASVYLLTGCFGGIVSQVFADGFKHPPLQKTQTTLVVDDSDEDDEDVTLVFKRRRV